MRRRFFESNLVYRIVGVMMALALWAWVSISGNPLEQRVVLAPIEYENLAGNRMIASQENNVNVRIEGRREDLEFIHTGDVVARVDLQDADTGPNHLEIRVEAPPSVQVVALNPSRAAVTIAEIETRQQAVVPVITGEPREGYSYLEPRLVPGEVMLEGPGELLDRVDTVTVSIMLQGDIHYERHLPPRVLTEEGEDITHRLRLTPAVVEVRLPVIPRTMILEKPVHVPLAGSPASGYRVAGVRVEPATVVVDGEYMEYAGIPYLETPPLDLTGLRQTETFLFPVIHDEEDVRLVPREVQVTVIIEPETE